MLDHADRIALARTLVAHPGLGLEGFTDTARRLDSPAGLAAVDRALRLLRGQRDRPRADALESIPPGALIAAGLIVAGQARATVGAAPARAIAEDGR